MWRWLAAMIVVVGFVPGEPMAQSRSYPVKPMRWVVPAETKYHWVMAGPATAGRRSRV